MFLGCVEMDAPKLASQHPLPGSAHAVCTRLWQDVNQGTHRDASQRGAESEDAVEHVLSGEILTMT